MKTSITVQQASAMRKARIALARKDINTFLEFVMKDEATGVPLYQAPCHEKWHEAAEKYDRLCLFAHVECGKTNQISIGRTLFELGRNPNLRIALVSNTYGQAERNVRSVASYIETSAELHEVFPNLKPAEPWTHSQISVECEHIKKDASVQAVGIHGSILGARLDLVILDDILDYENTLTARQRDELWNWYHSTLAGRLTQHARVLCVGTAWHPNDAMHRWERQPDWHCIKFPILDDEGNTTWPERWPMDRIDRKRIELGPLEFARQMLCKSRDDGEARFKQSWIDECLDEGDGCSTCDSASKFFAQNRRAMPREWRDMVEAGEFSLSDATEATQALLRLSQGSTGIAGFYTGVDLAVQKHAAADLSVFFTVFAHPDGSQQVVEVDAGKWTGPEIVQKIISVHERFGSIVIVENNAAQDFILQFVRDQAVTVPVLPFTTGKNKANPDFGIESMAAEFAATKWIIPSQGGVPQDKQVAKWIEDMLHYDPRGHTGDRLMASWFARELIRRARSTYNNSVGIKVIG